MILSIKEFLNLKTFVEENSKQSVHLHDACGGQYFSLDYADEETKKIIEDYFDKNGVTAEFAVDKKGFTLREK